MRMIIKYMVILCLGIIATTFLIPVSQNSLPYPVPSPGTMVKSDMEERNLKSNRHVWIESMHRSAADLSWRDIEYRNSMERQLNYLDKNETSRNGQVFINEGYLSGEWIERGSNNQAGSVHDVEYDPETNEIFLISAGGSLFKADFNFQYWEIVNDRFKFDPGLLKIIKKNDGAKRMVALINKEPHFSDDMGLSWHPADAYNADFYGQIKDAAVITKDGQKIIFILAKTSYWKNFKLYASYDHGVSYQKIQYFTTFDANNLALTHVEDTGDVFIIEQFGDNNSSLYRYDHDTGIMVTARANSSHAFGQSGRGNLAGVLTDAGSLKFFSYNEDNYLYSSIDTGRTWQYQSQLPVTPWEVRLFVSANNPDLLIIGAVECYRSLNGGKSWNMVNAWPDYYANVSSKLHADIMHIDEFKDQDGNNFITISNHGGLSISYDEVKTTQNIGEYNLNISQYYSVRTSPKNPSLVLAGSQDQGLQRGLVSNRLSANLKQVISGDYGHNVFTLGGDAFWTVYPGGWVTHYSDPQTGFFDASWELNSQNETVWLPPLIQGPDPEKDQVVLAGGEKDGGSGSFLILLSYQNGKIIRDQMPFDFHYASNSEISAIAISRLNPDNWYVATKDGHFFYSTDGGYHFDECQIKVPGSHYLYGSCILPSKIDEQTLYLSGSGYSTAGVLKSIDGGKSFVALTHELPETMVFDLATNEDESLLFAATEAGPYVYIKYLNKWFDLSRGIAPTQSYWSVEYISATNTVRYGTYGRGIWDFNIDEFMVPTFDFNQPEIYLKLYPNPASSYLNISIDNASINQCSVEIFDINGRNVLNTTKNSVDSHFTMDVSTLEPGQYLIRIITEEKVLSKKFIKN